MEQHPVPQNVTTFQFRLVGDMTLKQFGYLASGVLLAYISSKLPLPFFFGWPLTLIFALGGFGLAFVPVEERPMDIWVASFLRNTYNPTQYVWQKRVQRPDVTQTPPPGAPQATAGFTPANTQMGNAAALARLFQKKSLKPTTQPPVGIPAGPVDASGSHNITVQRLFSPFSSFEAFLKNLWGPFQAHVAFSRTLTQPIRLSSQVASDPLIINSLGVPTPQPHSTAQQTHPPAPSHEPMAHPDSATPPQASTQKIAQAPEIWRKPNEHLAYQVERLKNRGAPGTGASFLSQQSRPPVSMASPNATVRAIGAQSAVGAGIPMLTTFPNIVTGIVKDERGNLLPGALITVRDPHDVPLRALKTNRLGQFAASTPLPVGTYLVETEDPLKRYAFDRAQISINNTVIPALEIHAKTQKQLNRDKLAREIFGANQM